MLLPNHLHQHPLWPAPVELAVEDLLPRPEIELAARDRDDHFPAHDLPLEVRIPVVLAGVVVTILRDRLVRRERLQPALEIGVQAALVSLMNTDAVMCIALTSTSPSRTPLSATQRSTSRVMFSKPTRAGISNHSSLR